MIDEYNHRTEYFYDANGNTVEQTTGTDVVIYDYDDQNRLIYLDTGTSIIGYEYDAKGIRVAKTVDGEEQNYLVDHLQAYAQVLEETDAAGVLQARYTQGNDLLAMNRGSDVSYYHYDALGSTRALTDAAGVLTDAYDYEAYGEILQSSGTTENAFLFTGEQRDPESGHYYLRARYYDPSMGRFVTRDTWEGDSRRPMSLNKYIYTEGNPVVFVDPSGHFVGTLSAATAVQAVLLELIETAIASSADYLRKARRIPWTGVSYKEIESSYPTSDPCNKEVYPWLENQCAMRMSVALREHGLYDYKKYKSLGYEITSTSKIYEESCRGLARHPSQLRLWIDLKANTPFKYSGVNAGKEMRSNHSKDQGIYVCTVTVQPATIAEIGTDIVNRHRGLNNGGHDVGETRGAAA